RAHLRSRPELGTCSALRVLGVDYWHLTLPCGDDLYLTRYGEHLARWLLPENYWTDDAWFRSNSRKLSGTSMVYRIRTKPVDGRQRDIVLKWNRMGQDVPGETQAADLETAAFNSPFEEFALVQELRTLEDQWPGRVLTHKPLAIFVPREIVDPRHLGRKDYKLNPKLESHTEVQLDRNRNYAVIYEWLKGIDAAQAMQEGLLDRSDVVPLVHRVTADLETKGMRVRDNKPQHVIVRPDGNGGLRRDAGGKVLYATVDFELLERTPQREQSERARKRRIYLVKQAYRFNAESPFPPHLRPVNIMGVDYVFGRIESTGGALWVVGRDADLFDYFLPERWRRTERKRLSVIDQVYETTTKDNIRLVWKVSRVGQMPDMDPFRDEERPILEYGYNSPFEEVSLNMELSRHGVATTYPRAIYMTGSRSQLADAIFDPSRFETHADLRMPDGGPILRPNHDYMLLRGYWNGPDELLAVKDQNYYQGISALAAYRGGMIDEQTYLRLMGRASDRLTEVGIEDLNLRGTHLLLSINQSGHLVNSPDDNLPEMLICNFELLRRTAALSE
ncbi:MAG: hypothetical protein ACLFV7_09940, partial [Phycisphaerae bacterium]